MEHSLNFKLTWGLYEGKDSGGLTIELATIKGDNVGISPNGSNIPLAKT